MIQSLRAWAWLAIPPAVLSVVLAWPIRGWVLPYAKSHELGERGLLADGSFDLLEKAMRDPVSKSFAGSLPVLVLALISFDLFLALAYHSLSPSRSRVRTVLDVFPRFLSVRAVELGVFIGLMFASLKVSNALTLSNDRTTDLSRGAILAVTALLLGAGRGALDVARAFLVREGMSFMGAARSAAYLLQAQPKWFAFQYGSRALAGTLLLAGVAGGLAWHPPSFWVASFLMQLAVAARYALRVSWLREAVAIGQPVRENWSLDEGTPEETHDAPPEVFS